MKNIAAAAILALGLIVAGLLVGGRYSVTPTNTNAVTRLDRLTGEVVMCVPGAGKGDACGFVVDPETN